MDLGSTALEDDRRSTAELSARAGRDLRPGGL